MKKITLIGNSTLDICIEADFSTLQKGRQSEAPIHIQAGGGASNVGRFLGQLASDFEVYSSVGDDPAGELVRSLVPWELDLCSGAATEISAIGLEGERTIINQQGTALLSLDPTEWQLDVGSVVVFGYLNCCGLGLERLSGILAAARRHSCITIGGLNGVFRESYRSAVLELLSYVDYLIMNRFEAQWLFGRIDFAEISDFAARRGATAIVTLGNLGTMLLGSATEASMLCKPEDIRNPRSLGAGDAFLAGFSLAIARGDEKRESCKSGHLAATRWAKGHAITQGPPSKVLTVEGSPGALFEKYCAPRLD